VAVDPVGSLLIADSCNNRVRRVDDHGVISTIVGTGEAGFTGDGGPATAAMVQSPDSPVFDHDGVLYIQEGLRVRRIDTAGVITTVAGIGKAGVPRDGMSAMQAPFPELYGLAVDAAGQVYLADGSTTVYRIDTTGILTVFAGPLH
jgi:sugar lactone lactonase YvrE